MSWTIAAIGAGGKTTALRRLAAQAAGKGCAVLFTTTTHIRPIAPPECRQLLIDPEEEALLSALARPGVVCAGRWAGDGRLSALPGPLLDQAVQRAQLVLYEGDGSRGLPLKLHRPDEPVVLPQTDLCLITAGLSALGQPVGRAVHRYGRNPDWAARPEGPVGPDELLDCIWETADASGLPLDRLRVLLNQADSLCRPGRGEELAERVRAQGLDCRAASLERDAGFLWNWLVPLEDRRS